MAIMGHFWFIFVTHMGARGILFEELGPRGVLFEELGPRGVLFEELVCEEVLPAPPPKHRRGLLWVSTALGLLCRRVCSLTFPLDP